MEDQNGYKWSTNHSTTIVIEYMLWSTN